MIVVVGVVVLEILDAEAMRGRVITIIVICGGRRRRQRERRVRDKLRLFGDDSFVALIARRHGT